VTTIRNREMTDTGASHEPSPSRRPARVVLLLLLVIGAVLLPAAYWLMAQGPGTRLTSPPGSTVAEFSGTGDEVTDTFQVREGWDIHWQNGGDRFAFAISGDRDFGTVIDQREPGSGITSPVGGGTFRLEITADGDWSVEIRQGD
jgi:hypothetical protein